MRSIKSLFSVISLSGMVLFSTGANASLILRLDDLSTAGVDVEIVDGAGGDWAPGLGWVAHIGTAGSWAFNLTGGLGNGVSSIFGIDLGSISASSPAGGTLRISLTETDLSLGAGSPISVASLIGGTTQGTVTYNSWLDDGNLPFGMGSLLFSGSAGPGAFSAAGSTTVSMANPFSLTLQVDITHVGMKATSFDFAAQIPEPSTVALLGIGLLGLAVASRRKSS